MTDCCTPIDPIERLIYDALIDAGIEFEMNRDGIDFYLTGNGVYIECKQFFAERIVRQMSRVDEIIVVQGVWAARSLAHAIRQSTTAPNGQRKGE